MSPVTVISKLGMTDEVIDKLIKLKIRKLDFIFLYIDDYHKVLYNVYNFVLITLRMYKYISILLKQNRRYANIVLYIYLIV